MDYYICIILGIILSAQLTQAGIRQDIPTKRIEEMASLLNEAESERDKLRLQLYRLQAETDEIMNKEKVLQPVFKLICSKLVWLQALPKFKARDCLLR